MSKWADFDDCDLLTRDECILDKDFHALGGFTTKKKKPPEIITLDDDDDEPGVVMDDGPKRKEEDKPPDEGARMAQNDSFCSRIFLRRNRTSIVEVLTLDDDDDEDCASNPDNFNAEHVEVSPSSSGPSEESGFNEPTETSVDGTTTAESMVSGFLKLAEFLQRRGLEEPEPLPQAPFVPVKGDYDLYFDALSREMNRLYPGQRERTQDDIHVRYNLIEADLEEYVTKKSLKKLRKKLRKDKTDEKKSKRKHKKHAVVEEEEEAFEAVAGDIEDAAVDAVAEPVVGEEPAVAEPVAKSNGISIDVPVEVAVAEPVAPVVPSIEPVAECVSVPASSYSSGISTREEVPVASVPAVAAQPVPPASTEDPLAVVHLTPEEEETQYYSDHTLESFSISTVNHSEDEQQLSEDEMELEEEGEGDIQTAKAISEESPAEPSPPTEQVLEPVDSIPVAVPKPKEPENLHPLESNGVANHQAVVSPREEDLSSEEAASAPLAGSKGVEANKDNEEAAARSPIGPDVRLDTVDSEADVPSIPSDANEASKSGKAPECELEEPDFEFDPEEKVPGAMSSKREPTPSKAQGGASPCSTHDSDSSDDISPVVSSTSSSPSPIASLEGLHFTLDDIDDSQEGWKELHGTNKSYHSDYPGSIWDSINENMELLEATMKLDKNTGELRPVEEKMIRRIFLDIRTNDGRDLASLNVKDLPPGLRFQKGDEPLDHVDRNTPLPVEEEEEEEDSVKAAEVDSDDDMFKPNPDEVEDNDENEVEDNEEMFTFEEAVEGGKAVSPLLEEGVVSPELEEGEIVSSEDETKKEVKPLEEKSATPEAPAAKDDDDGVEFVCVKEAKKATPPPPSPPTVTLEDDDAVAVEEDDDIEILEIPPPSKKKSPATPPKASSPSTSVAHDVVDVSDDESEKSTPGAAPVVLEKDTDISMEDLEEVDDTEDGEKKAEEAAPVEQEPPKRVPREVTWKLEEVKKTSPTGISMLFASRGILKDGERRWWIRNTHEEKEKVPVIPLYKSLAGTTLKFDLGSKTMFGRTIDLPMGVDSSLDHIPLPVIPPIGVGKTKKRKADAKKKRQPMHELLGVNMAYGQHKKYHNQGITIHEQWELNESDTISRREKELYHKGVIMDFGGVPINNYSFPYNPYAGLAWPIFQPTDGVPIEKEHMMDQADVRNQLTNLSLCNYTAKPELLCDYQTETWDNTYEDGRRCRSSEDRRRKGRFKDRVGYMRKLNDEDLGEAKRRDEALQKKEMEVRKKALEQLAKERAAAEHLHDAPQEGERLSHEGIYCRDGRMDSYVNKSLFDFYSRVSNRHQHGGRRPPCSLPSEWFSIQMEYYIPVNDRRIFLCEYVNFYNKETVDDFKRIMEKNGGRLRVDNLVRMWQLPHIVAGYVLQRECKSQFRLREEDSWEAKERRNDIKKTLPIGGTVKLADVKRLAKLRDWEYKYWTFIWDNLCSIYRAMPPIAIIMKDLLEPVDRVFRQMAPASHREAFYRLYKEHREDFLTSQRENEIRDYPEDRGPLPDQRFNPPSPYDRRDHYNPQFYEEQPHFNDIHPFDNGTRYYRYPY